MRKYCLLIIVLLKSVVGLGQDAPIKTELPTIIPPSPTVAALMKFEEVPVSNYTGVPDISIPLFKSATLSKDINLDISLKYHPSGVAADERASDVGLGWSLFAGGTISRTVRGLPDEILTLDSGMNPGKVGLYHTCLTNHNNYFYEHENDFPEFVSNESFLANEYIWGIVETGKFDTEHDLWQFNFMGNSGRFYIKKNLTNNQLEIVPLDDYRIKIINKYSTSTICEDQNNYIPTGFTVYDEKGYKYVFDVIETTTNSTSVLNNFLLTSTSSVSAEKAFNSAFHLSKVFDNNDNLILEYLFNTNSTFKECIKNSNVTAHDYYTPDPYSAALNFFLMQNNNCFGEFKPIKRVVNSNSIISVKKIQTINVIGFSKINFTFEQGERLDSNLQLPETATKLTEMLIKSWNGDFVKKYKFGYDYSTVIDTRMELKTVEEFSVANVLNNKHELYYEENDSSSNTVGKDYWGYFNLIQSFGNIDTTFENDPTPSFSTTDVLQKIKYPTGGCAIFDFEANRYSFIGAEEITNFDENPDNFEYSSTETKSFSNANYQTLSINVSSSRKIKFYPSIVLNEDPQLNNRNLTLYKKVNGIWVSQINLICSSNNADCCIDYILEQGQEYAIRRNNFDNNYTGIDTLVIKFYNKTTSTIKFLYGGGNRIKRIGYFDEDVDQTYYKNSYISSQFTPKREKSFTYTLPSDVSKSSGSLVFAKPLFEYDDRLQLSNICSGENSDLGGFIRIIEFKVKTTFNNLISLRTQGVDVGYKYVTVSENGKGSTDYTYYSPIDFPEEILVSTSPPFLPSKNIDYKRGLPIKEVFKNQSFLPLQEINYNYVFVPFEEKTGNRRYKPTGQCFGGNYFTFYSQYLPMLNYGGLIFTLDLQSAFSSSLLCGYPSNYTEVFPIVEAFGWAKLDTKKTINYYYDDSNNQKDVETFETYTYHPTNKQIDEHTVTNSLDGTLKTKYFYLATVDTPNSKNNISTIEKVETYRGSDLLSTSKINYSTNFSGNTSYLPESIQTSKGSGLLENRIRYNAYDNYGHPLEVQQENGMIISYLWGYNQSQPIAKIENATNAQVESALGMGLEAVDESNLPTNLRSLLPNAMITTYTYKPLVGVSTITDPRGMTTTYEYDSFGRLKWVKDYEGNILSENEYHYRTQN